MRFKYLLLYFTILITSIFFESCNDEKELEVFTKYHLGLIEDLIERIDHNHHEILDTNSVISLTYQDCQSIQNDKLFDIKKYEFKVNSCFYDFEIIFRPPTLCSRIILDSKELNVHGGRLRKNFSHIINDDLSLEVLIEEGFKDFSAHLREKHDGVIAIYGKKQNKGFVYKGKYDISAIVLIPKNLKEWNKKHIPKSLYRDN